MGKRELVALLSFSSWCLVIVVWLFFAVHWVSLQFMIVVFPDHTHLLFFTSQKENILSFLLYMYIRVAFPIQHGYDSINTRDLWDKRDVYFTIT